MARLRSTARLWWLAAAVGGWLAGPVAGACAQDAFVPAARILTTRCLACHNANEPSGGLNLTAAETVLAGGDSGPAVDRQQPLESLLLARVTAGEMPPPEKAPRLADEEKAALTAWIAAGAPWPAGQLLSADAFTTDARAGRDWWSLRPVQPAMVPIGVEAVDWVRGAIDAFVSQGHQSQRLTHAPEADRATLLRRLKFDLLGLPPTPEEIGEFVADASPESYEKLVDRLLASPHFGQRWGRHWLDVVRYADSHGFEMNNPRPTAWPYRDWVIGALNADLPYDQFVLRQLAGDQLGDDAATGFLVAGPWDQVKSPDPLLTAQQRMDELADIVGTLGAAFMGLSTGCARCHDHKFDPITQQDYYALQAVVAGVQHGERPWRAPLEPARRERLAAVDARINSLARELDECEPLAATDGQSAPRRSGVLPTRNVDRFAPTPVRRLRFVISATNDGSQPCLDELEMLSADDGDNFALASRGGVATASSVFDEGANPIHQLAHVNDGRYGNGRSWISNQAGAGWVQIELPATTHIDRVVWGRDRERTFADRVPTRYRIEVSESPAGDDWRLVASSDDRTAPGAVVDAAPHAARQTEIRGQLAAAQAERSLLADSQQIYAGRFEQTGSTHRLYRGDPMQPREPVAPGGVLAVGQPPSLSPESGEAQRRLAIGRWLGSASNPLAARVAVNRLWHHHFGQGLVATPSDFGWHGGLPSHPQLLDWLAARLVEENWSLKRLHRLMVSSAAYRQSSQASREALAVDADNRWLWRFAPRRLEAEPLRDAILSVSGHLDARFGGPGYDAFEPNENYVRVYVPRSCWGPAQFRRMVYQHVPRMRPDGTFGAFDCPDGGQMTSKRNVSTTPLQAMNLLNSPFLIQQAGYFAERLRKEAGSAADEQVNRAFWLALGRAATDDERSASLSLAQQHGLEALCRALFNANEFLYVP